MDGLQCDQPWILQGKLKQQRNNKQRQESQTLCVYYSGSNYSSFKLKEKNIFGNKDSVSLC